MVSLNSPATRSIWYDRHEKKIWIEPVPLLTENTNANHNQRYISMRYFSIRYIIYGSISFYKELVALLKIEPIGPLMLLFLWLTSYFTYIYNILFPGICRRVLSYLTKASLSLEHSKEWAIKGWWQRRNSGRRRQWWR